MQSYCSRETPYSQGSYDLSLYSIPIEHPTDLAGLDAETHELFLSSSRAEVMPQATQLSYRDCKL